MGPRPDRGGGHRRSAGKAAGAAREIFRSPDRRGRKAPIAGLEAGFLLPRGLSNVRRAMARKAEGVARRHGLSAGRARAQGNAARRDGRDQGLLPHRPQGQDGRAAPQALEQFKIQRVLDYLQSRPDVDPTASAFMGSHGAGAPLSTRRRVFEGAHVVDGQAAIPFLERQIVTARGRTAEPARLFTGTHEAPFARRICIRRGGPPSAAGW